MSNTNNIQSGGFSRERLDRLSSTLEGYVERGEVAGVVTLLHRRGVLAHVDTIGWQDREARLPMRRDTLFRIASMTKPITAVAALTLIEDGRIHLHDSLDAWLPELAGRVVLRDPNGSLDERYPSPRPITLHDLLTYRLGIGWGKSLLAPRIFSLFTSPLADILTLGTPEQLDPDAWMDRLSTFPLLYAPGERWLYHVASDVLGVLIARVANMPFEAFLRQQLFEPLGMIDTSFSVPPEKRQRLAVAYGSTPVGALVVKDHPQTTAWADAPLFPSGGGGLISTVDDYLRFSRMLLNQGELDGVRILSREMVEAMTTDYLTPEQHAHIIFDQQMWINQGFGYGVAVQIRPIELGPAVGTFSWPGALGTAWYADPQNDLVAIQMIQLVDAVRGAEWRNKIGEDFLTLTYQAISD